MTASQLILDFGIEFSLSTSSLSSLLRRVVTIWFPPVKKREKSKLGDEEVSLSVTAEPVRHQKQRERKEEGESYGFPSLSFSRSSRLSHELRSRVAQHFFPFHFSSRSHLHNNAFLALTSRSSSLHLFLSSCCLLLFTRPLVTRSDIRWLTMIPPSPTLNKPAGQPDSCRKQHSLLNKSMGKLCSRASVASSSLFRAPTRLGIFSSIRAAWNYARNI